MKRTNVYFFLGKDVKRARVALGRALDAEKKAGPNAVVTSVDGASFDPAVLEEALGSNSLFGGRNIVSIDGLLENEMGEEFYCVSEAIERSTNLILVRETDPKKELRTRFGALGDVQNFPLKETESKVNNFAVSDAVAARDKRTAWVEFTKLARSGAKMEEVHGTIFWAIKTLLLCKTETREEAMKAGVKDYTFRKFAPHAKRFLRSELEQRLMLLKRMYHEAHEEDVDLGVLLEQFLLKA